LKGLTMEKPRPSGKLKYPNMQTMLLVAVLVGVLLVIAVDLAVVKPNLIQMPLPLSGEEASLFRYNADTSTGRPYYSFEATNLDKFRRSVHVKYFEWFSSGGGGARIDVNYSSGEMAYSAVYKRSEYPGIFALEKMTCITGSCPKGAESSAFYFRLQ